MCEIGGKKNIITQTLGTPTELKNRLRSNFGPKMFELSTRMVRIRRESTKFWTYPKNQPESVKNYHSESELSASRVLDKSNSRPKIAY